MIIDAPAGVRVPDPPFDNPTAVPPARHPRKQEKTEARLFRETNRHWEREMWTGSVLRNSAPHLLSMLQILLDMSTDAHNTSFLDAQPCEPLFR